MTLFNDPCFLQHTLLASEGKGRTSRDQEKLSTHGANAEINLNWCFCVCATDSEPQSSYQYFSLLETVSPLRTSLPLKSSQVKAISSIARFPQMPGWQKAGGGERWVGLGA